MVSGEPCLGQKMLCPWEPQEGAPKLLGRNGAWYNLVPGVKGVESRSQAIHRKKQKVADDLEGRVIRESVIYAKGVGVCADLDQVSAISL